MKRFRTPILTPLALLFLWATLLSIDAVAQQKTLKEQVVGTWM